MEGNAISMMKHCKICNKEFKAIKSSRQFCTKECLWEYLKKPEVQENIREKGRLTKLRRYGDENFTNRNKAKQTCIKKYGVDNVAKSNITKEITKKTNLQKYGTEWGLQNKEIRKKSKQTCMRKYGVDIAAKSDIIKAKAKQTCLQKYGVVSPTQVKEIHDRQRKTCLKKYGYTDATKNAEIKEKIKNIFIEKYGETHPLKTDKVKQKLIKTNLLKYGTAVSSKSNVVKEKRLKTCLEKFGASSAMGDETLKNKNINARLKNHYYNIIMAAEKFNGIIPRFKEEDYAGHVSYTKKYPFQCKKCNTQFEDTLLCGHIPRCPECFPPRQPKQQKDVYDYIKSIIPTENIEEGNRKIIPPLELDIYIPSKKIAIEFNGLYWHSEASGRKNKIYHINKTNRCEKQGIRLIHIFEDEWLNKQKIVKNKLKHILNVTHEKSIYARNCIIKEINSTICNEFLNKHHIQGEDNSSIKIGLFYKNELVSVMSFGRLRLVLGNRKTKERNYEMYRFATSKIVSGAGGKLLDYFIKTYKPLKIISYADRRWSSTSSFYTKLGFKLTGATSPNYWYIPESYGIRIYRYNFAKHTLKDSLKIFNPELTEWQNMQLNNWDRIWDCGSLKYELILDKPISHLQ